jgi:hypothetical protein
MTPAPPPPTKAEKIISFIKIGKIGMHTFFGFLCQPQKRYHTNSELVFLVNCVAILSFTKNVRVGLFSHLAKKRYLQSNCYRDVIVK